MLVLFMLVDENNNTNFQDGGSSMEQKTRIMGEMWKHEALSNQGCRPKVSTES